MSFTNLIFPVYLIVVLAGYYLLPKKVTWLWLLLASWFFYAYGNLTVFLLLPGFSLVTYLSALGIEKTNRSWLKKGLMIFTLIVIFGTLFVFKYLGLFASAAFSLARFFGLVIDDFTVKIILPVGISFYTFQTAAYVIDVYLGNVSAERHFGYYALFVSYFPQLVAGPIERFDRLMPQLKEKHAFDWQNVKQGALMLMSGYVKKVAVADVIARAVNAVYNSTATGELSALAVILASVLFYLQIYCDFSGYSDIATGIARIMGVKLMKNFNHPFAAESITDFWSRWHISLSGWFGEYVYRPLAFSSRRKKNKMWHYAKNTLIVMLLSGFWHGAEWSFVVWGLLLAVYQIVETALKKPYATFCEKHGIDRKTVLFTWLRRGRTIALLVFSLILFRANDMGHAAQLYARLFTGWQAQTLSLTAIQTCISVPYALAIVAGVACMSFIDRKITFDGANTYAQKSAVKVIVSLFIGLWLVLAAWSYLTEIGQVNSFIYFQF